MPDPIDVERRFVALKRELPCCSSGRLRILRTTDFLQYLLAGGSRRFLRAYLGELLPPYLETITHTDFTGTPAALLQNVLETIGVIQAASPQEAYDAQLREAHSALTFWLSNNETWATAAPNGLGRPNYEGTPDVWIPFVEREPLLHDGVARFGLVKKLRITVQILPGNGKPDEVTFASVGGSAEYGPEALTETVLAAKRVVSRITRRSELPPIRVICGLDQPALLSGDSIKGGIAAGIVCGLLEALDHREMFRLRDDVAITARVDASGRFLPVDPEALRVKVEACRFSPIRVLIVSKEQSPGLELPGLLVFPVTTLADIFDNRRLTASRIVPRYRRILRLLWKRRRIFASLLIGGMALALARVAYGPLDRNPVTATFSGTTVALENANRDVIQRIEVGERTVASANQSNVRHAAFYDVDGDGMPEAILAIADYRGRRGYTISCWSLSRKDFLWHTPVADSTRFPRHPSGMNICYNVHQIAAGDFDADGVPEVWMSAISTSFSHLVMKLAAPGGEVLSRYVHIGQLSGMLPIDMNHDGITEIALCGANNAYDQACVLLLDPRDASGYGPTRGIYTPDRLRPANHLQYLLIPRTAVGEAFKNLSRLNTAVAIAKSVDPAMSIRVSVLDADLLEKSHFRVSEAFYYLDFDSTLTPRAMATGNDFDLLSRQLVEEGRIPSRPDQSVEYQRRFLASFPSLSRNAFDAPRRSGPP